MTKKETPVAEAERYLQQIRADDLTYIDGVVESGKIPEWSGQILMEAIDARRKISGALGIYVSADELRWNSRNKAATQAIGVYDEDRVRNNLVLDRRRSIELIESQLRRQMVLQADYIRRHVVENLHQDLLGKTDDNQVISLIFEGQKGWFDISNLANDRIPLSPEQTLARLQVAKGDESNGLAGDLFNLPVGPDSD
jgi:hypothetical protein